VIASAKGNLFPLYQVQAQDLAPLFVLSLSLLLVAFWTPSWRLPSRVPAVPVALFGLAAIGMLAWGTYALMGNFPLSRDEHMVVFDMAVFDKLRLAAPLAPEWRPYAKALVPAFLLNDNLPSGLVSVYLPMNALLRLAFSKLAVPTLLNPMLAFLGGAALLDIARRTFGRDDPACWVVLLIYGLSAQMLVNSMTTYSMTAHMALNLVWLAAFLRGGKWGHAIAIAVGFIATGLHQLAFHPFFVASFLLWRLRHGQWKLVLGYGAAYAVILAWWAYYPILVVQQVATSLRHAPDRSFVGRVAEILVHRDGNPVALTILNLLRFIGWQNLALLPLFAAGAAVAVRQRGLAGTLLLGIVLWAGFIAVVLPYQGHGWGYRYLHPYLGSFALLTGYGYRELGRRIGAKADGVVLTLSAISALVAIPLTLAATHRFVEPHVALERMIASQSGLFVLVDTDVSPGVDGRWTANAIDHVRNLPDLTNRPLRFSSRDMNAVLLVQLCRRAPVTLITRMDQHRAGFALNVPAKSEKFEALVAAASKQAPGCFRDIEGTRL
jgi:hypothetical protein